MKMVSVHNFLAKKLPYLMLDWQNCCDKFVFPGSNVCLYSYPRFCRYCRFYMGRRAEDDGRQIGRWQRCAGVKGRWRNNLISKCVRSGKNFDDFSVSPVVRQTLQHWGYILTHKDFAAYAKKVKLWSIRSSTNHHRVIKYEHHISSRDAP